MIRRTTALAAVAVMALLGSSPAQAHSNEVDSNPAANSRLQTPPTEVSITFDEPLIDAGTALIVTGADGTVVSADDVAVARNTVTATVTQKAPAGEYTVAYRIVSQDGHAVTGTFTYLVLSSGIPTASASSPSPQALNADPADTSDAASQVAEDGSNLAVNAVIALAVLVVATLVVVVLVGWGRRRRGSSS